MDERSEREPVGMHVGEAAHQTGVQDAKGQVRQVPDVSMQVLLWRRLRGHVLRAGVVRT